MRASLLVEVAKALAPEHQSAARLLDVLLEGLDALDRGETRVAALAFPKLLRIAGIAPSATRCGRCGRPAPERVALDLTRGLFVCPSCAKGSLHAPTATWCGQAGDFTDADAALVEAGVVTLVEAHLGRALSSARALTPPSRAR